MSERDTGFSASAPARAGDSPGADASRNTAEFRAFASKADGDAEAPWSMRAPGRNVAMLAGVVILVAVVLAIIAIAVLNA